MKFQNISDKPGVRNQVICPYCGGITTLGRTIIHRLCFGRERRYGKYSNRENPKTVICSRCGKMIRPEQLNFLQIRRALYEKLKGEIND